MPLPKLRNESSSSKRFNINDAFIRTISSQMKKLVSSYGAKKEGETSSHYSSIISPQLSLQIPPLEPKESLGIHEETKFPKKLVPLLSSMDKSLKGIKKDLEKKNKEDKVEEKMFSSIKNFFTSKSKPQQKDISKRVPSPKQFLPKVPLKKTLAIGTALGLGSSSLMNVLHSSSSETNQNHGSGGNPPGSSGGNFLDGILSKVLTTVLEGSAGVMGLKILKEKIFGISKAGEEVAKGTEGLAETAKATKVSEGIKAGGEVSNLGGEIAKGSEGLAETAKATKVSEGIKAGGEVSNLGGEIAKGSEGLGAVARASKFTKVLKAIPLIGEAAMVVEGAVDNSKEILDTGVLSFSTVGKRAKENANAAFDTKTNFFTLDRLSGALGLLQNAVIDAPLAIGTNISKGLDDVTGGKISGYVSDAIQQISTNGTEGYDGAGTKDKTSGLASSTPPSQVNKESGLNVSTPIKEALKESGINVVAPITQASKESAWGGSVSSSSNYSFGGPVSSPSSSTSEKETSSLSSSSSEKKDVSKDSKETVNQTSNGLTSSSSSTVTNNNDSKVTPGINGLSSSPSSNLTFNDNSKVSQEKGKGFSFPSIDSIDELNPIKMNWSSWSKPVNKVMNENVSEVLNDPLGVLKKINELMPQKMLLEKAGSLMKQLPGIPGISELSGMAGAITDPMKYMKKLLGFGGEEEKDSKDKSNLSSPSSNPMDFLKNLLGFGGETKTTSLQGINGLTIPPSSLNLQNTSSDILSSIQGNSNLENRIPPLNNPQSSSSSLGNNNIGSNPFSYLEQLQQQTTLATTNKVETSSPIVIPVPPPNVVVNNSSPDSKKPLSPYSPDPSSLRDLMAGNRLSFA